MLQGAGGVEGFAMPIKPSERKRYPLDWKNISQQIKIRAQGRCECMGECGIDHREIGDPPYWCFERNGEKARTFRGKVIFTVAHLDHMPENCAPENLKAMCQRCHLRYDRHHHAANARKTREAKSPQLRFL